MKKILIIVFLIILMATFFTGSYILVGKPYLEQRNKEKEFETDLNVAFQNAITQMNLPEGSIVMYDSYYSKDKGYSIPNFELSGNKYFYIASGIKPLYIAATINLLSIKDPNYPVPFKFIDDEKQKSIIASDLNDYLAYGRQIDPFIVDYIAPYFVYKDNWTSDEIMEKFLYAPDMKTLEFPITSLIQTSLGPSSNLSLALLRSHLAFEKYETEKAAASAIEKYLNDFLLANNKTANMRIYMSENSEQDKRYNATKFSEMEYLYEFFWDNKFELEPTIWESMKEAMLEISDDPNKANRRHEMKSIVKGILGDVQPKVYEKSGYIGLDLEAIPGLNTLTGWDKLPSAEGKRVVIMSASSFSRTYFKNGKYVQFNYSISVPVYIKLDPHYEELNDDYLKVKNDILKKLEDNLAPVVSKYKDNIEVIEE
jgi:hypothetical protein